MESRINTRMNSELKHNAALVFDRLGISESEAIRMFYAQVHLHQGLPFEVRIPNAKTRKALQEADTRRNAKHFTDTQELFTTWDAL